MKELKLPEKFKKTLDDFIRRLRNTYEENLISIILYGSAASGEFTQRHSNINLLIVLNDTGLDNLNKVSELINRRGFQIFDPLFLTEDYIKRSSDVFPIEFLDMKENYVLLHGKDVLRGLEIGIRNLRFQCEQELKAELINIKDIYLKIKTQRALRELLFESFTSTLHILRNLIRLKGKSPSYQKADIIADVSREFNMDIINFNKILEAKQKNLKPGSQEIESLFFAFVRDLEKIIDTVDRL